MMASTIPLIILNWNNASDSIECLQSVLRTTGASYHIFMIDNASEREDANKLQEFCKGINNLTFIANSENLGFGKAHNEIFKKYILQSEFKHVVLLNNDTTVETNWLTSLVECADEESAGMVSAKMLNYHDHTTINNLGHKFQNTGDILPIANNELSSKYTKRFVNAGASGGAALYSVAMLRDIGLFDEYFFCGYEDAELGLRAMIAGYKLVVEPRSIIYHKVSASVDKVRDYDFTLKIQLDIMYSYFKLMPWPVILVNAPFAFARNLLLLLVFLAFGRFKYLKIFFHGWKMFLVSETGKIRDARRDVRHLRRLSSWRILRRQEFFLVDNIKRFNNYFIKGNKTVFERF